MTTRHLRRAFIRVKESVEDWSLAARSGLLPLQRYDIQRFNKPEDLDKFIITTDEAMGEEGYSEASLEIKKYTNFSSGLFSGEIDWRTENPLSKGGFANFRTAPSVRPLDLSDFSGLEMRVKTDGRPYVINVKSSKLAPEFLWQIRVLTEPYRWTTVAWPWEQMIFVRRGRFSLEQMTVDAEHFGGWGVLLGDGANGPFRFEMQYLRAIREWSPEEYAEDDKLLLPENQRRLAEAGGIVPLAPGAAKSDITQAPLAPLHEGDDVRGKMSREDQREMFDELRENAKFTLK